MADYSNIVGRIFEAADPFLVTVERIANFCAAVGDVNPLYVDAAGAEAGPYGEIIAPPPFAASIRHAENVFEQLPLFGRGGLMGGIELGAPICAGDSIRTSSGVREIYEKPGRSGTMVFVVVRSTLTNQKDEVVARVDHRMMHRRSGGNS